MRIGKYRIARVKTFQDAIDDFWTRSKKDKTLINSFNIFAVEKLTLRVKNSFAGICIYNTEKAEQELFNFLTKIKK